MKKKPTVISLFSGAGCFDYGFEAAGYETKLTTDFDFDACATISISRPDWLNIHTDINDLDCKTISTETGLKKFDVDVLIGGPPCQPFSKSAYGTLGSKNAKNDPRSNLVNEYFRILDHLCPKVFVIENVPQFISGPNIKNLENIRTKVSQLNKRNGTSYKLSIQTINAAWYGVPQLRNRVFIVGERNGKDFVWPEVTHFEKGDKSLDTKRYLSVGEALKGIIHTKKELNSLQYRSSYSKLLEKIPPGMNYLWFSEIHGKKVFKSRSRFWNFLLKLSPLLPSWTITAQPGSNIGPFHWENRRLSEKEIARIQTIPANVEFFSSTAESVRKQIGNGVPSLLGEILGNEIKKQFLGFKQINTNLNLMPSRENRKTFLEYNP